METLIKGLLALLPEPLDRLRGTVGFHRQAMEAIEWRDEDWRPWAEAACEGLGREECRLEEAAEYLQLLVELCLVGHAINIIRAGGVQWTGRLLFSPIAYHRWVGCEVAKHLLGEDSLLLDNALGKARRKNPYDCSCWRRLEMTPWHC